MATTQHNIYVQWYLLNLKASPSDSNPASLRAELGGCSLTAPLVFLEMPHGDAMGSPQPLEEGILEAWVWLSCAAHLGWDQIQTLTSNPAFAQHTLKAHPNNSHSVKALQAPAGVAALLLA